MPSSAHLRAVDVRAVFLLVGECRELGDDPAVWWTHYAGRLATLVGAEFAGCGEVAGPLARGAKTLGVGEWGWDHGFDREPWERSVEMFDADPEYTELYRRYFARLETTPGACLARSDLAADREWAGSVLFREVSEPMGVDHYLWCYTPAGVPGRFGAAVVCRAAGRPDFSAREKALVREAQALVAPLAGGPLASFAEPAPTALPVRARQVLRCLLEGDSDKEAAARLGISRFTVNHHAKQIHLHFGVQTRAELLGRWVKRQWGAKCAWADPPIEPGGRPTAH